MAAQFVIGIDLGTTNCVLAYTPLDSEKPEVKLLPIPQLVAPSTVESRDSLPSFTYLANASETAGGLYDLPDAKDRDFAVGEVARKQSAEMPDRTVGAAKSWLSHSKVDRHQA
ncbi:MAG: Hsp70 family protein, partial [Dehalococcoidia bacterium]